MSENIIAIVGRPNVGKSTLFNRLTVARTAIEEKVPGVTRDRLYGTSEWCGRRLVIIDTGGVTFGKEDPLTEQVRYQVGLAVDDAQLILFLLDGREGLTALDEEIADMLRRSGKIIIPVVNKIDFLESENLRYNFYSLGLGEPFPVSASHGRGTGELLDRICEALPRAEGEDSYPAEAVKVAVIGRPNVGKSSLINAFLGEERVIVNSMPGTTRDSIDTWLDYQGQPHILIDTAGIRRQSRVKDSVEYYSVLRSLKAVERADLALLLLDGEGGITEQDQRLAGYVDQAGRGLILVVNKWDLAKGKEKARELYMEKVQRFFNFVSYAPVEFVSALTGKRLEKLFPIIQQTWQEQHKRIKTSLLNDLLEDAIAVNPPPTVKGKKIKFFYMTQPSVKPPTFVFFVNEPDMVHFSYMRYLENRLRESFAFKGTPVILKLKKRQRREE
ncbi:MAG TPA: ribosome biogenesis GTPase Der [Candidatus Limnocylindrales bacterium]|nr:ribosome biogenesis GTPase Der [Candidatus Limnocylindrales bacterium]